MTSPIKSPLKLKISRREPICSKEKRVFGTGEWAVMNANFIDGCQHDCKYCYSKEMAIRFGRKTKDNWKEEFVRVKSLNISFKKTAGRIMFPSSHDIHPEHLQESLFFISRILDSGNSILIVTKPHLECIQAICGNLSKYKPKITFRFSIGSADSAVLQFWEPGAPDFYERLESLKYAFQAGFKTSVSCEPVLDGQVDLLVERLRSYITDSIWIGKANSLIRRLKINGELDETCKQKAMFLLNFWSDEQINSLFSRYQNDPIIKWKESIKVIVGIDMPEAKGLDL